MILGNDLPLKQGQVSLEASPAPPSLIFQPRGKRFKCAKCPGHWTFRDEVVYDSQMYNHHDYQNLGLLTAFIQDGTD